MALPQKQFSRFKKPLVDMPNLMENQLASFEWFKTEGLKEIFDEFSPLIDYSGKKFELSFERFEIAEPKYDEHEAKVNEATYEAPLKVHVKLKNKTLGTEKEQEIFMADMPLMTEHGTFIINGVERVVVPQLARSFGVMFTADEIKGNRYFGAKVIPARGAWVEFESDPEGVISVRIDKKRKVPVTSFLRAFSEGANEKEIAAAFTDEPTHTVIEKCFAKDPAKSAEDAYIEIYKRLRDGELAAAGNARDFVKALFSKEKYDLSPVGRFRLNKRFGKETNEKTIRANRTLTFDDIVSIVTFIVKLNNTPDAEPDNIDHLGSRRVRFYGEMIQQKIRVGMTQMKRNIQDRMSTVDSDTTLPVNLISPRPLQARIKEFFTTNQLSQFMNQENILSEVEHLRTLSALGPGGLTRERAGLEVRDVHPSHYGRVCPIHTPEGPNIGLILHLSVYARINPFGMIETPYAKVVKGVVTKEIVYLDAFEEEQYAITHAATPVDKEGNIVPDIVAVRRKNGRPEMVKRNDVQFIDVAPNQAFSIATSMIPFLEHNDANRALMGSNMQKQAIPCVIPEVPLVATGIEERAARDTGRLVIAEEAGTITVSDARRIVVKGEKKDRTYKLLNYVRTNSFTGLHQRPIVSVGDKVKKGQVLADMSSSKDGQMALGQNVLVAFMLWDGANYEDAIIISERMVRQNKFANIKIEEFVAKVRETKLGPEVTTHDIPNVGEAKLKDLDEEGIIRIGAEVESGDILVGRITPKGETELTAEERLLRSIFGDKARDVKDTSIRMEHGKRGRVIGVKVFSRERGDNLDSGILKQIHVEVANLRNLSVGDKLAGRHGNKGVVSRILPVEEMPFMEDGTPVDIILTPLGVPSRMNLGQILELHLGMAANSLGYQAVVPTFLGATETEVREELTKAGFQDTGKMQLYDGRTGEPFAQQTAVGYMYMLKLNHMVQDKIHMRSIGPYSLITQQPLGGKAQEGGQRFGEMEVWALEGYGAAHALREMLTVKSDDILGRTATFDAIVKQEPLKLPNIPASFNVLLNNLRGLALDVSLENTKTGVSSAPKAHLRAPSVAPVDATEDEENSDDDTLDVDIGVSDEE
ncbi:MAG: DNA-directed RNA polymerase subunit beta [Candidatus Yonathbacteria bacterium]|nr:DNA-directed RNA polymerase subunit beta [Candidatus Yonathbacteria bacterium]